MSIPGYDEWKLRTPDDEAARYGSLYDDEEDEPMGCPECGMQRGHYIGCSEAPPEWRVKLWRAWHWHIKHWRSPSIAMVQWRVQAWWRRRFPPKPPAIDEDIPF